MADEEDRLPADEEEYNDLEDELSSEEEEEAKDPRKERRPKKSSSKQSKKRKPKRSAFIDDAAEEDEDGKKTKKSKFIDDIAEVDDEEDEDEEEDGFEDLFDDQGEVPDAVDMAEVHRAMLDAEAQFQKEDEINPEELRKYLKEHFAPDRVAAYAAADEAEVAGGAVSQQALMPTHRDPKLWVIRCGEGQERMLIVSLLQKCYDYASKGIPLLIKSAFAKDNLKGFIYVEAHKETHVREALKGLSAIYHSKPPKLVPLPEMVSAVTVARTAERGIRPGAWVRPRAGVYRGDLGRVASVDMNSGRAVVKLLPRLDYAAEAQRRTPEEVRAAFGKQPKVRPPPRPFNYQEAKGHGLELHDQRDRYTGDIYTVLNGSQRFHQGYLVKNMAIKSLVAETGLPPLEELQRFNAAATDENGAGGADDLEQLVAGLEVEGVGALEAAAFAKARFDKGDLVIVVEGDLRDIKGRVEHVTDDGQVLVRPTDEQLEGFEDAISFAPKELKKYFEGGDHVRAVAGEHDGQNGMVVSCDNLTGVCVILTDATQQEIRVLSRDLTQAVAAAAASDSLGEYSLFDLVQLTDVHVAGVIVGVDKDSARVLTTRSRPDKPDVRICKLQDIQRKLMGRRSTATDEGGNEVSVGDIVEVVADGSLHGSSGTVKQIAKGCLFVHSKHVADNGGYICLNARLCRVRGGKTRVTAGSSASSVLATPARSLATPNPYAPGAAPLASPARHEGFGGGGYGGGGYGGAPAAGASGGYGAYAGRQAVQQDRLLVGKTVRVRQGPCRGMTGTVKSATPTHIRVELEAQYRVATIPREYIDVKDGGSFGQPRAGMGMMAGPGMMGPSMGYGGAPSVPYGAGPAPGGRTPAYWSQATATPAHYSMMPTATPLHPSMTPSRDVGKTPAHDPAWAMTPAYTGFGGGNSAGADVSELPTIAASVFGGVGGGGGSYTDPPPSSASAPRTAPAGNGMQVAADAPAPVAGASAHDWVGLEVELPSGEHAAVRSLLGKEASVQIGRENGERAGSYVFSDGTVRSVPLSDLKLAEVRKSDVVRVLAGEHQGQEGQVRVFDNQTKRVFLADSASAMSVKHVLLVDCAKLAVDAT